LYARTIAAYDEPEPNRNELGKTLDSQVGAARDCSAGRKIVEELRIYSMIGKVVIAQIAMS
jgi:hypothetical protein